MDELPEQQTRMMHLMSQNPTNFDLKLGFDACCTCGTELGPHHNRPVVSCSACRRVNYCSDACRERDANVCTVVFPEGNEDEDQDRAMGHTSVICALLNLCNEDEAVEEEESTSSSEFRLENPRRRSAAQDRNRSEYESYPATLANVIDEGPCYQKVIRECARRVTKNLAIHVVGASEVAELWGNNKDNESSSGSSNRNDVYSSYAEALSELASSRGLDSIELLFVGPDCPEKEVQRSIPMQSIKNDYVVGQLCVRTCRCLYTKQFLEQNDIAKPDIVVFFNPGFTVPEYEHWNETLASIAKGTPFLSTTNTELEGIADCQYLLDQDKVQSIPPGLAYVFGVYSGNDDDSQGDVGEVDSFFSVNPFCGSRIRQSGTMANDLFVKNRWMLGGIMDSFDPSTKERKGDESKKKRRIGSCESVNCKANNPSLI